MSFIIANQKSNQNPAYFTTRYRNELNIPANAEIALYQSQINVNPKITIDETNDTFALMYNYNYTGFAEQTEDQNDVEYEINKYINAQNLLPNLCKVKHGKFTALELSNQLYYASTFGDKQGFNSYTWTTKFDSTNNKFQGYQISIDVDTQGATVLNDSSKFVVRQLDDDKADTGTITTPDATSINIEKSATAIVDAWDCDYQIMSCIYRNGSRVDFKILNVDEPYYFGFTRNIYEDKGFQNNFNSESIGYVLPEDLKINRLIISDIEPEIKFGTFMDYAIKMVNGNIHILYLDTFNRDGVCQMTELRYWETGILNLNEIVNTTTDNTLIRFTFNYDMVQIHYSINDGADYTLLVRGNEWKGISSATTSLYPRISLKTNLTSISLDMSNASFLEPQGATNTNNQRMTNSGITNVKDFTPENAYKLGLLNWDYNLTADPEDITDVEENVCLAIRARQDLTPDGFNQDITDYMVSWDSGGDLTVGSKLNTPDTGIFPIWITENNNINPETPGERPTFIYDDLNSIVNVIEIPSILKSWHWFGTPPNYTIRSAETPSITNSASAYIRIDNLPLQTFNSANESISRIIGIMPRFNESRSIGHIYKISNPPVYVKLNNTDPFKLSELRISIVNDDESLAEDLLSQTQLIFHLKN